MRSFVKIASLTILLAFSWACSDSGLKGVLGGSDDTKATTTEDSKKPTDNSEGIPGYLVDPEMIELLVENETATVTGDVGSVQTNSGSPANVYVKIYGVASDLSGPTELLASTLASEDGSFDLRFPYDASLSLLIVVGPKQVGDGAEIEKLVTGTFFVIEDPETYEPLIEDEDPPAGPKFDSRKIRTSFRSTWDPNYGSITTTAELPVGQIVSGTFDVDVRVIVHNFPGELMWVKIKAEEGLGGEVEMDDTCPYDGTDDATCAFNYTVSVDTTAWEDGWRDVNIELRTKTPDDKRLVVESGIPLHVDNGTGSSSDVTSQHCGHKSLMNEGDYNNVDDPEENIDFPEVILKCTPLTPVSGDFDLEFKAREEPTGNVVVTLDGQFAAPAVGPWAAQDHADGTVIYDEPVDAAEWHTAKIDTTTLSPMSSPIVLTPPRGVMGDP